MKKFLLRSLFSILICLFLVNISPEVFSQDNSDDQAQLEENTSQGQELDDAPAGLDEILDEKGLYGELDNSYAAAICSMLDSISTIRQSDKDAIRQCLGDWAQRLNETTSLMQAVHVKP